MLVPSTATSSRLSSARPRSGVLVAVAIAVAALSGSAALVSHGGVPVSHRGEFDLDVIDGLALALTTLPLVAWERSPMGVFALTASASVLLAALGFPIGLALGPAAALYLFAASRDEPLIVRDGVVVVGLFVAFLVATAAAAETFPASELLHTGLAWAVAWFAGERSRLRRAHLADLEEGAARAGRDAERERLLAAAQERARIARDLHDSAGHAINVIVVRAGAARLRHDQDPDRSVLALEAIEGLARQTAEEIDQIVGTLRDGSTTAGVEAPPELASLDTLIAHHTATGLDVTCATTGDRRPLAAPADQAAYRILQEALTNAARHGAGSARLQLDFADTVLEVTITNPVPASGTPRSSGGHGLVGMRERVTLLGGSLDVARDNGTFVVHARIPYRGHHT